MERLKTTAWYTCSECKKVLHGENFYRLTNGCRTNECCKCYDKQSDAITYDGDDPKCDQEYVARCRENWGGIWNG